MDIQVQELINKIKKDGIESSSQEAARIKKEAETEARHIIEAAEKNAEDIVNQGKHDAERFEKAGIAALEQASRNLLLAFKDEIKNLLDRIVSERVSANYNDEVLKTALPDLIKAWAVKGGDNLSVILPESELSKLQSYFGGKLSEELKKGVELKASRKLASGFRISNREGSVYYDFSADAVAALLSTYLNPKLTEILNNAAKGI
jgi:V/A-type H+-transporting ATPase subunit E